MSKLKKSEIFLNQSLDQVMSDRFARYSKYIIQDRALPDARDGLKPVQRRILYSMEELGLNHGKPFKKSARIVGDVIGKYHPHGDSSIYEAMVRLSQDWKMNVPLVEMHGNNGSIDDDPAAAMRYTEVRLAPITQHLILNLKKDTVAFAPNFDDSEREPTVLPALFPNLLVNGAKGIAAGYATEIPPHNLSEIVDAIIAKIKSPNIKLSTLLSIVKGPDFPTGGIVQGEDGIYKSFERGHGRIIISSKYTIEHLKNVTAIRIMEIPYGVVKAKLIREIDEIRISNKISGIKTIRDESDQTGLAILIEISIDANVDAVLNYLLAKTEMQIYYNYNCVAIKDKAPFQMNLIELLDAYLKHQKEIQRKALKFDLNKHLTRLEIVEGFIKVAKITNPVIDTIRKSEGSKKGVISILMSKFGFTLLQANAIADLRLYRLSKTDQNIYLNEKNTLSDKIEHLQDILNSTENFDKFLITRLKELKKNFGEPRKTQIESKIKPLSVNFDALVQSEDVWVGISQDGYVKRLSKRIYESNIINDYSLKEYDSLKFISLVNTKDKLLVFTNLGNYVYIPVYKIEEMKFKDLGKHLNDWATIAPNEKVVDVIVVSDFSVLAFIVQLTRAGRAKKTLVKDFEVSRLSKTYKSIKLTYQDELVGVKISNDFKYIIILNNQSKAVKYSEKEIPIQGLLASGVKAINLVNSQVCSFVLAAADDVLGFVSNRGGMKRIKVKGIVPISRNSQGKQIYKEVKNNPHVVIDARIVGPNTQVLFFLKESIISKKFLDVDSTSLNEGMSIVVNEPIFASKIMSFDKVNAKNSFLSYVDAKAEEDQIQKAENALSKLEQLSIDDLLKDL